MAKIIPIETFQVYRQDEVEMIADLCIKHDVACISDEVYEWMIYSGNKHIKIGKSDIHDTC